MSLSLFNAVPAGTIEVLNNDNKSYFKRADLGRFLGIADIARNFKNVAIKSRSELSSSGWGETLPRYGMRGGGKKSTRCFR